MTRICHAACGGLLVCYRDHSHSVINILFLKISSKYFFDSVDYLIGEDLKILTCWSLVII